MQVKGARSLGARLFSFGWGRARCPAFGRELKARELESGRDRAADQRPIAEGFRRLPGMRRHHRLRAFAGGEVASENDALGGAVVTCSKLELERTAGVIVPDFGRVD